MVPPGVRPPPPFTGIFTPFFFSLFELFGLAAFYVALILVVPPFAAIATGNSAAEVVLVFDLLNILGLLLPLQLRKTGTASIAVRRRDMVPPGCP